MGDLYRPRAAVSGAFALGTLIAFGAQLFVMSTRPSELRLPWTTQNDLLNMVWLLVVYSLLFYAGLLVLRRHAHFRGRSMLVAVVYGGAVYFAAFFALLVVFHLAVEPSISHYLLTMACVSFVAGVVFARFCGRAVDEAG